MVFVGQKENKIRKALAFQKGNESFQKGGFRTIPSEKCSINDFIHTKARAKIQKEKAREVSIHRQDLQPLKIPLKRDLVLFGNQTIGTQISLTILQQVRGTIQDIRLGWRQFPWILPIRRTLFWIFVAHYQLDRERQSEGSINMLCITVLLHNSVPAISFCVCQLCERNLSGKLDFSFYGKTTVFYQILCA